MKSKSLEEDLVFRGAAEKTNWCELNGYLKDACLFFKDWAILLLRCGNWSSTDTSFLGPAALPFLPSLAMTNVYPLAGLLVFGFFLFMFCAYFVPGLKFRPLSAKKGAREYFSKLSWSALQPMWQWQYPELHLGVVSCLWNETQDFRLADLFGEASGEGRIILKGWLGGEGWLFCGLDKQSTMNFLSWSQKQVSLWQCLCQTREFHFYQAFNKFRPCSLETGDTQTDPL